MVTGPVENKISQYADDTNFPIQPTLGSFNALIDILDKFSSISGLKPNYKKCKVLRVGSLKYSNFKINTTHPLEWTDGAVDVLGVHIPVDLSHLIDVNFYSRLEKARKILQPWQGRGLTLYEKVSFIKSLVISQFTYLFVSSISNA